MSLNIAEINKFKVKRVTDFSYILSPLDDSYQEVFMHFNQAKIELKENDTVDAFLYFDNKHRLCATLEDPIATASKVGFAKVVSCKEHLGCFINIGITKDVLLSKDYLPENTNLWPKVDEELPIILKIKRDSIVAKIIGKHDLEETTLVSSVGSVVEAVVTAFTSAGIIAYTKDLEPIFIHKSLMRSKYHLGEKIYPHIVNINEHNELNGSLIEQKEKMRLNDSEMILKYLNDFGGVLMLGNSSTPEEIAKVFPLSKSAFKRAVGALYKERLITIEDNKIKLVNKE